MKKIIMCLVALIVLMVPVFALVGCAESSGRGNYIGEQGPKGNDGITPHIGSNGNWWIGNHDTRVPATGPQGSTGSQGNDGITPHIGSNGNWWIGDYDTRVSATGPQGDKGDKGDTGDKGPQGNDGLTPHIGPNGNWWIGDYDTRVPATGPQGDKGDTGAQGDKGDTGAEGPQGPMPSMRIGTPIVSVDGKVISWKPVGWALGYAIYVDGEREEELGADILTFDSTVLGFVLGGHEIRVRAITAQPFVCSYLSAPITNVILPNFQYVSVGSSFTVALDVDGNVWTWGRTIESENFWPVPVYGNPILGHGEDRVELRPRMIIGVEGFENIVSVTAGRLHSLAIDSNGDVWVWGAFDSWGAHFGLGEMFDGISWDSLHHIYRPRKIEKEGFGDIVEVRISGGDAVSMALDSNGDVWTWGFGLANGHFAGVAWWGEHVFYPRRIKIDGFENIVSIEVGATMGMALDEHGYVWTWGQSSNGGLGHGEEVSGLVSRPRRIEGVHGFDGNINFISAYVAGASAIDNYGNVWTWGSPVGHGFVENLNRPKMIQGVDGFENIVFVNGSFARNVDGDWWVLHGSGGIDGWSNVSSNRPVPVNREGVVDVVENFVRISSGASHSFAWDMDGNLWFFWGTRLELGNGYVPYWFLVPYRPVMVERTFLAMF